MRRLAEKVLHRTQDDLEVLVAQREPGLLKSSREQFVRRRTTNWTSVSFFRTAR